MLGRQEKGNDRDAEGSGRNSTKMLGAPSLDMRGRGGKMAAEKRAIHS